ncbi:CoA transferase [Luminiphilus sp.]|jgi:crotonobetainyl-CoA:carnitine CoA-transferase CaiB-like acyl-CoA transferase|nr:CoA transferase [Luminiphilus sp.]MDC0573711.1 CoA transferase [Luminiphilus sp.]MDC1160765.1 CaiB/BaiF CoA-transferase family protein [Luminiphilus sp.]
MMGAGEPADQAAPLRGIKVIEFTHMVMGPTAGVILGDLGADVIKVEPLKGDNTRRLTGSGAGYFPMYNRNKRSIALDLKNEKGREIALQLIQSADIVLENFRPGTMAKLGLDYDSLKSTHPRLIYCSLKGFLSGPYENRVALDEVTQMMGGLAYMTGLPNRPLRAGSSVIDITGGMFGVIAILSALHERQTTEVGSHITSALFETTAFLVGQHMAQQAVSGEAPPPMSVRQSAWAIYDVFQLDSGERLFVGIVSDSLWYRFCEEFELAEWAADDSLSTNAGRVVAREHLLEAINRLFSPMSLQALSDRLDRAGLPFAPINTPGDLFNDPHLTASGGLLPLHLTDGDRAGQQTTLPRLPVEFGLTKPPLHRDVPQAGAHNHEVLSELGLDADAVATLIQDGVISR